MTQAPAANHHHRWPDARRPDGSMHPAVDGMMIEYRLAFYSFFSGLVSFHLSRCRVHLDYTKFQLARKYGGYHWHVRVASECNEAATRSAVG